MTKAKQLLEFRNTLVKGKAEYDTNRVRNQISIEAIEEEIKLLREISESLGDGFTVLHKSILPIDTERLQTDVEYQEEIEMIINSEWDLRKDQVQGMIDEAGI